MNDPIEWGRQFAKTVKEHIQSSIESLRRELITALEKQSKEIEQLKSRQPEKGEKGDSVTVDDLRPVVKDLVASAVEELPKPKDGEHGKSVSVDDVMPALLQAVDSIPRPKDYDPEVLRKAVEESVAAIPKPKDGTSVSLDDVLPPLLEAVDRLPRPSNGKDYDPEVLHKAVQDAVDALPRPKDGEAGVSVTLEDVRPLVDEGIAKAVAAIAKPRDGVDGKSVTAEEVFQVYQREFSQWALGFERHAQDLFQRAVEKIPVPKDGADGLGFDDMTVLHDGERSFTLRFVRGEQVKEFPFVLPIVIDRGYHKDGNSYAQGDGVTHGGSYWIAQKATQEKPEIGNVDWRLAVKKGRDGKNYSPPVDTPRPPIKVGASN